MPCEEAEQHVKQTRSDRKPCCLEMEIAAPAVLIGEHVPIAGRDCIPGRWQVQIEPGVHVYVAGLAPVKPWMRKHDLSSADEQTKKAQGGYPVSDADQGRVPRRNRLSQDGGWHGRGSAWDASRIAHAGNGTTWRGHPGSLACGRLELACVAITRVNSVCGSR